MHVRFYWMVCEGNQEDDPLKPQMCFIIDLPGCKTSCLKKLKMVKATTNLKMGFKSVNGDLAQAGL